MHDIESDIYIPIHKCEKDTVLRGAHARGRPVLLLFCTCVVGCVLLVSFVVT